MTAPRLEIRLDLLHHNAKLLVERLGARGIGVTGVTKATLGSPEVARCLIDAGVTGLGESRIENVERLRAGGITAPITLIRSPMISQADAVVAHADRSLNTEPAVLAALSAAAVRQGRTHEVILMVELGDLREGILPELVPAVLAAALALPNLEVQGIGANLACQHGIAPDEANMGVLSSLIESIEARTGHVFQIVSGGNSASYDWALGTPDVGRVNDLRLGEAYLLGCEPLHRTPIDGLHPDAITLVAEIIERSTKPTAPWGTEAQTAFGGRTPSTAGPASGGGSTDRAIVALGRQDVDLDGLVASGGTAVLGASSDHLVLRIEPGTPGLGVGDEVRFGLDYRALLRAMTSPFVTRAYLDGPISAGQRTGSSGADR